MIGMVIYNIITCFRTTLIGGVLLGLTIWDVFHSGTITGGAMVFGPMGAALILGKIPSSISGA